MIAPVNSGVDSTAEIGIKIPHLAQINTVPDLYQFVGEETCARWEAMGQASDKIHWGWGMEVEELVAEGAKVGLVCKAIGVKAGRDTQTIRKAWYVFKAYSDEDREKYHLAPYSVFQQARTQEDKYAPLEDYINNRSSVDEIIVNYPEIVDKDFEKYFKSTPYPRIFYGVLREIWLIDPIWKQEADQHIQALHEIIERCNK